MILTSVPRDLRSTKVEPQPNRTKVDRSSATAKTREVRMVMRERLEGDWVNVEDYLRG